MVDAGWTRIDHDIDACPTLLDQFVLASKVHVAARRNHDRRHTEALQESALTRAVSHAFVARQMCPAAFTHVRQPVLIVSVSGQRPSRMANVKDIVTGASETLAEAREIRIDEEPKPLDALHLRSFSEVVLEEVRLSHVGLGQAERGKSLDDRLLALPGDH